MHAAITWTPSTHNRAAYQSLMAKINGAVAQSISGEVPNTVFDYAYDFPAGDQLELYVVTYDSKRIEFVESTHITATVPGAVVDTPLTPATSIMVVFS